jgi:mono/diheme cytochrome c family protein
MKKIWIITVMAATTIVMISCSKVRRSPGRAYMPDMAYSRAIETYSSTEALQKQGIHYTSMPVAGTIARGDMAAYELQNDSAGYVNSKNITNPLPALDAKQFIEATRLYLVNCGICHGEKLDGNGPLWKDGTGPYPAAPRNLLIDPVATMPEGTIFHSITYGKGQMGSYASQLSTEQRWMIVHYIKEKQAASKPATTTPVADTAAAKKPN